MRYFFPIHLNGNNRGCEGISKGTALILNSSKDNLIGLCTNLSVDQSLQIDKYIELYASRKECVTLRLVRRVLEYFSLHKFAKWLTYSYNYDYFLKQISEKDLLLSTGGDMMCYGNNQVIYTTNRAVKNNVKCILWGCSIGEKNLTSEKLDTLHKFTLIYARESITGDVLKKHGLENVVVYPDPAFILEPISCRLPSCFNNGEVIGINLSSFTMGGFSLDTPLGDEIKELFDYIFNTTSLRILLIPHVLWVGQDDRIINNLIADYYQNKRISILDISTLNYCQIRYIISKCKYFIGARTHAMISAYSTKVPSIAIGYSVKSAGIVKDIGLSDNLLIDSQNIEKGKLLSSFQYLQKNEIQIRNYYNKVIDDYKSRVWNIRKDLENIMK